MKKYLFLTACCMAFFIAMGQKTAPVRPNMPVDPATKLITYEAVVELPGTGRDELYNRAKAWVMKFFKNPQGIVQKWDSAGGKIEARHKFRIYNEVEGATPVPAGYINYSLYIFLKDGMYKYRVTRFEQHDITPVPVETWMGEATPDKTKKYAYLIQIDVEAKKIIRDLTEGMKQQQAGKKLDEW